MYLEYSILEAWELHSTSRIVIFLAIFCSSHKIIIENEVLSD